MAAMDEHDQLVLRIFALLFVNSFLIGAAVAIHERGLWFPEEDNWLVVGGLFMMAASFVQMVAFMAYKVFFQERLEDQAYTTGMSNSFRRMSKRMNAQWQRAQLAVEMDSRKRQMEEQMAQTLSLADGSVELTPELPEKR